MKTVEMTVTLVPLAKLRPHPRNPRIVTREDVVEQIAAQLNGSMEPQHALLVRPAEKEFEIISGHHRLKAAEKAGLTTVPCHVVEMDDDEAYMALLLHNAQSELLPLEVGLHALGSGMDIKAYAAKVGVARTTLQDRVKAAAVYSAVTDIRHDPTRWSHLAEIHAAPQWLWGALVGWMQAQESVTVEQVGARVKAFKDLVGPPDWTNKPAIAEAVVVGDIKRGDVPKFAKLLDASIARLERGKDDAERFVAELRARLQKKRPEALSDVEAICIAVEAEQRELTQVRRQGDLLRTQREEQIRARTARLRRNVSLDEWKDLAKDERETLLNLSPDDVEHVGSFNAQETADIEWAQWSWNPVTGCLHDCPYCYARDIALQSKMATIYPHGFAPTFRPATVLVPRTMKLPKEAAKDGRYRNVFTCSMADLFGRWVPNEWIERILDEMRAASQWNFLCLTKFPKRMAEFEIPPNTWMGTTVDMQARVAAAEAGFDKLKCEVRWLSVEPMLESLRFKRLDLFDWIVIGGASASTKTPEWHPPISWVIDLCKQARDAGTAIYMKSNLLGEETPRILELPKKLPVTPDAAELPESLRYLGKA